MKAGGWESFINEIKLLTIITVAFVYWCISHGMDFTGTPFQIHSKTIQSNFLFQWNVMIKSHRQPMAFSSSECRKYFTIINSNIAINSNYSFEKLKSGLAILYEHSSPILIWMLYLCFINGIQKLRSYFRVEYPELLGLWSCCFRNVT